jgi:hypothetical protein
MIGGVEREELASSERRELAKEVESIAVGSGKVAA